MTLVSKFFCIGFLCLFAIHCGKGYQDEIRSELEARKGNPTLFWLNQVSYSASHFRDQFFFERKTIHADHGLPSPKDVEAKMNDYIEETVILNQAIAEVDYDSAEARKYLSAFLRKAAIAYYLEKKSGALALNLQYDDIHVSDDVIEKFLNAKDYKSLSGLSEEEKRNRIRNTAIHIKWQKLKEAADDKKKIVIGKMKKENKVRIINKELFSIE
ncbi:hypothetical protein [Leptospira sp. 'Mane']|uniref:hypothetical protein n=1 Tax=Leptospira sp. 'Mane' TaxID=3387407 RepID=UPI00398B02CA